MNTETTALELTYEAWLDILSSLKIVTGLSESVLLDKTLLPKNIRDLQLKFSALPSEEYQLKLSDENYKKIDTFLCKYAYIMGNFLNKYVEENENTIDFTFSYKGEIFSRLSFSIDQQKIYPQALNSAVNAIYSMLISYTADEETVLKSIDENPDYYYGLFNNSENSMKIKLRIWKENYPKAYEKLVSKLEIPRYEEFLKKEE